MNSLRRLFTASCAVLVFSICTTVLAQKQDDVLSKANQLLKGYKPPPPTNQMPKETPSESWRKSYEEQVRSKHALPLPTSDVATPKQSQFRHGERSQKIQERLPELQKLQTPEGLRSMMDEVVKKNEIRKDEQQPPPELKKVEMPLILTREEMDRQYEESIRQDALKRGIIKGDVTPPDDILEKERAIKERMNAAVLDTLPNYFKGTKFNDLNNNGQWDNGEPGLAGWMITVTGYYYGGSWSAVTDSTGAYFIQTHGYADYYFVRETQQGGWTQTKGNYDWVYRNAVGDTGTYDFGNRETFPNYFTGTKFNDLNNNGQWDVDEPPLAGWTITVTGYYNGGSWSAVTDSNGKYFIATHAYPDYYFVNETQQSGWYQTKGNYSWIYRYAVGDTGTYDFGNRELFPNYFTGTKFNDLNNNGQWDVDEPPLAGWTITVTGYYNGGSWSAVTDSNGKYFIATHAYPDYYFVNETQQSGWYQTKGNYSWIYRYAVGDTGTYDFGNRQTYPNYISGMKFNDLNHNGYKDEGEPGLAGWTINVSGYNYGGSWSAVTDSNGMYLIETHAYPDYYFITEVQQTGWYQTTSNYSWVYLSAAGDTAKNYNFGNWLVPPSAIQGYKFSDLNNNGSWDAEEPGLEGWKIFAYKVATGETLWTYTDVNGFYSFDSLDWVSYYYVFEEQQLDWIKTYPSGASHYFYLAGDTVEGINFGNYLPPPLPLRVNTMPSYAVSVTYANAVAGQPLAVWGNVFGGLVPLRYYLDYGDGSVDSGIVTNRRYIGNTHSYATAGTYWMKLTIIDDNGDVQADSSQIRVFAIASQQIRVNMAIEKGLLYNYLNQYADGRWYDGYGSVAATGAACLAFEENGHLPTNDFDKDIYAEFVRMGLNYLFTQATTYNIYNQTAGNPDSDGDGIGVYLNYENYANGVSLLGVIGAHRSAADAQADTIRVGPYAGQTFYDFMIDAIDQIAFSQTDPEHGDARGGWRYCSNCPSYGSSDNSAVQWPGLVLEAAENSWGMAIPQFVKDELLRWLQYSQDGTGGFGYTGPSYWNNIAKTGSGIGSYAALGYTSSSSPVINALNFLDAHWNDSYDGFGTVEHLNGNLYAMYAVAKGLRIIDNRVGVVNVGLHNWYEEYANHLLDNATWGQRSDGSWSDQSWISYATSRPFNTAIAVLILTQGVIVAPPVAVIAPLSSQPPNTSFRVDGSQSFHQDPQKSIIEWLWDWDASDGVDWTRPDASGPQPTNPGYADTGSYVITLRVRDDGTPPLYDIETRVIRIKSYQNPPVAVAIPPDRGPSYAARVGQPVLLDGRASYDPDYPLDSVIAYNWDLNGDGIFGDAITDTVTVVFESEYNGQVGLRVYDTRGDSSNNIAYITIIAARKDMYVQEFSVSSSTVYSGDSLHVVTVFKNNDTSDVDMNNVLVRFYDADPLTVGNRLGGDYFVDLPVGQTDTVETNIFIPLRLRSGVRNIFVYLDANAQVGEWDETNNIASTAVTIVGPHLIVDRYCMTFPTTSFKATYTLPLLLTNGDGGLLVVDSIASTNSAFTVLGGRGLTIAKDETVMVEVQFSPVEQGDNEGYLRVYSNDSAITRIDVYGHGEYSYSEGQYQWFSGVVTIDGKMAPEYTAVGVFNSNHEIIRVALVNVVEDSVGSSSVYSLTLHEGERGLTAGDTLYFRVRSVCDESAPALCVPPIVFQPETVKVLYDIVSLHERKLSIPLVAGYNAVSWNVAPENNHVRAVFNDVLSSGDVQIILDYVNNGQGNPRFDFYIPALGDYNPLQWTNYRKGYFVKLWQNSEQRLMSVMGQPVCGTNPIPLNTGYNFVSYLPELPDSTWHALASVQSILDVALSYENDGAGNEYFNVYPDGNFTTIHPHRGYFIRANEAGTLTYPEVQLPVSVAPSLAKSLNNQRTVSSSGASFPQAIFAYGTNVRINGGLVSAGTSVKAVDADGIVCGEGTFMADGIFAIAIYADDPATPADEGAVRDENVKLFIDNRMLEERVKWTEFGDTPELSGDVTITDVRLDSQVPKEFAIHQNYPNPFNPTTSIKYELPKTAKVTLKIYDVLGREVRTLVNEEQEAGYHQVVWDGKNNNGVQVSTGIYTYRFNAGEYTKTQKMILVK